MPFDPNLPQALTMADATQIRNQFNGLKSLIDAFISVNAAEVDGTSTLPPGSGAAVSVSVTGNTLHFTFSIPQGDVGPGGPQGAPGEVTNVDLANAITGTSSNSNAVGTLGQGADFNYNQPQMQALMDKMDELINALRRA